MTMQGLPVAVFFFFIVLGFYKAKVLSQIKCFESPRQNL